jgi:hypothetical protein
MLLHSDTLSWFRTKQSLLLDGLVWFMVFNATFKNVSVKSWWTVWLVEETGVPSICCFSAQGAALRRRSKDCLVRNQDNVSEYFMTYTPRKAALDAVKALIQCGISKGKISHSYALFGHRDVGSTKCPGCELQLCPSLYLRKFCHLHQQGNCILYQTSLQNVIVKLIHKNWWMV